MAGRLLTRTSQPTGDERGRWVRWAVWARVWLPGLCVAIGAAVATAHGLYEVAIAAGAPAPIACLYPLITDGLALVAYASTARLAGHGRAYAWSVVVLAAGLSGLAQASYLAGGVASAPPELRFGVGAWPAIAAAIVAHLLFLLGTHAEPTSQPPFDPAAVEPAGSNGVVHTELLYGAVRLNGQADAVRPGAVQPDASRAVPEPSIDGRAGAHEHPLAVQASGGREAAPARDRALAVARRYAGRHGRLPTVTELVTLAEVGRGTAGTALKELRDQESTPHFITERIESSTEP